MYFKILKKLFKNCCLPLLMELLGRRGRKKHNNFRKEHSVSENCVVDSSNLNTIISTFFMV